MDGWVLTLHEFVISGEDAWVTANKDIPMNLSKYGGAYNGALIDSAVQEYDLRTGRLVLQLGRAAAHSPEPLPRLAADQRLPLGRLPRQLDRPARRRQLPRLDAQHLGRLPGDIETGRIEWTLGGKSSSFKLGPEAAFQWQHDVRMQSGSTVSMFDDHCCQLTGGGTYVSPTGPSRGLVLKLDQQAHTATLEAQYGTERGFTSDYMGDTQPLPTATCSWAGARAVLRRVQPGRQAALDADLPDRDLTYRATLEPWVGLPLTAPAGRRPPEQRRDHGLCELERRHPGRLLEGPRGPGAGRLSAVESTPRTGFETAIPVAGGYRASRSRRSTPRVG